MPTVTLNGFKHYYDDVGSGELLVLLHGANSSAQSFEAHYPELSKHFRIIAPDGRSLGRSEHVKSMPANAWVEDLKALLDYLNIEKVNIYGVSLGSRVGMRFAIDYPERMNGLMLQNIHIYLTPELNDRMNRNGGDGRKLPAEEQSINERRHGNDWLEVLQNYYNIRNEPELQEFYNLKDLVTRITCPILVVQSDEIGQARDSFDQAFEIKDKMPDRVKLAVIPHLNGREPLPPETLRSLMREFVGSLSAVAV